MLFLYNINIMANIDQNIISAKDKLDNLLGISDDSKVKTIDDYLNELEINQTSLSDIENDIKTNLTNIDNNISNFKIENIGDIQSSLGNIAELINTSKNIISHLYNNIINTDLIDTELVNATASFIEVAHRNTKEYIDLYKDRMKFLDKVKFEMIQLENKKELMRYKHELEMQKLAKTGETVLPENTIEYTQEDIIRILDEKE